jgi:hypothetical protein
VEKFWRKLEEQTEQVLLTHTPAVHAVAQALLDRNDLTGKQCIEIIQSVASSEQPLDSELLLKSLVEETIVNGSTNNGNGNGNGSTSEEEATGEPKKAKAKPKTRAKAKAKVE